MSVHQMIRTHPQPMTVDREALAHYIEACLGCAAMDTPRRPLAMTSRGRTA